MLPLCTVCGSIKIMIFNGLLSKGTKRECILQQFIFLEDFFFTSIRQKYREKIRNITTYFARNIKMLNMLFTDRNTK